MDAKEWMKENMPEIQGLTAMTAANVADAFAAHKVAELTKTLVAAATYMKLLGSGDYMLTRKDGGKLNIEQTCAVLEASQNVRAALAAVKGER